MLARILSDVVFMNAVVLSAFGVAVGALAFYRIGRR